jgi:hypothetical protein
MYSHNVRRAPAAHRAFLPTLTSQACSDRHQVWRERADDWYISNCENFALLFPGELLFDPAHAKSNVWSLYYTTALLWNFAIRSHYDPTSPAQVKRDKACASDPSV